LACRFGLSLWLVALACRFGLSLLLYDRYGCHDITIKNQNNKATNNKPER